jgi:hypothetical protein
MSACALELLLVCAVAVAVAVALTPWLWELNRESPMLDCESPALDHSDRMLNAQN